MKVAFIIYSITFSACDIAIWLWFYKNWFPLWVPVSLCLQCGNNTKHISSENKACHIANSYVKRYLSCMSVPPAAMQATAYGYLVILGHLKTFSRRPREVLSLLLLNIYTIGSSNLCSMFLDRYTPAIVFWVSEPSDLFFWCKKWPVSSVRSKPLWLPMSHIAFTHGLR